MGKKKSKIAKSKQTKASKQAHKRNIPSSLGGVAMSKGLSSKFQQQQQQQQGGSKQVVLILDANRSATMKSSSSTTATTPVTFSKKFHTPAVKKVFLSSSPPPFSGSFAAPNPMSFSNTNNNKQFDEQAEFSRKLVSLQEREAASRTAASRQPKKKSTLLQPGGAVASLVQSFQPASFSVEKSTTDLLQEAVGQMQNMEGVGQTLTVVQSSHPTPIRDNRSWRILKDDIMSSESASTGKNPFAALQEDDDEDEDDSNNEFSTNNNNNKNNHSLFPMAPATFTLLPRITPTPATTPLRECQFSPPNGLDADDIDPDL